MKSRAVTLAGSLIALVLMARLGFGAGGYASFQPGPRGLCLVRKPSITWSIQGTGGAVVTGCEMSLNGQPVRAAYDKLAGMVRFTPSEPLAPGDYAVSCTVELNGHYRVSKEWTFRVTDSALDRLPAPGQGQSEAMARANELRALLGLPPFAPCPILCAAAVSHASFMKTNRVFGHLQQQGLPGFIGAKPLDRAQAFGHQGGVWEDVAMAQESPSGFVNQLFHAPYHRIPFLQPGTAPIGVGFDGKFACINFGASVAEGTVVSPADGQTGVPCSWDGIETPSPLRIHNAKGPVGYGIMLSCFTAANDRLACEQASLKCGDQDVPFYLNNPENDAQLNNTVLIMPVEPLKPNTAYRVQVKARTASGARIEKAWAFTTGPK